MTKLIIRPAAEADIDAAADYYVSEENIELGLRSRGAVTIRSTVPIRRRSGQDLLHELPRAAPRDGLAVPSVPS